MKEFSCGDVVPGCSASFRAGSEDLILQQVARHALEDHGLADLSSEMVSAVKKHVRSVDHA